MKIRFVVLAALIFAAGGSAFAQGYRFTSQITQQGSVPTAQNLVVIPAGATVSFCNAPAVGKPCTNKATTYTDATLTNACPANTQIVLDGTAGCVANPDAQNNWGVWVAAGVQYAYTVNINGTIYGPYYVSSSTMLAADSTFTNNVRLKGQDPWDDVTAFPNVFQNPNSDSYAGLQAVEDTICTQASGVPPSLPSVFWPTGTYAVSKPLHVHCNGANNFGLGRTSVLTNFSGNSFGPLIVTAPTPASGYCMTGVSCTQTANLVTGLTTTGGSALSFPDNKSVFELRSDIPANFELNGATALTFEAYYNPSSVSGTHLIFSSSGKRGENESLQNAFTFGVSGNQATVSLKCTGSNPQLFSTTTLSAGTTYFLEAAWDGTTLRLYVGGHFETSVACASPLIQAQWEDVTFGYGSSDWPEGGVNSGGPLGTVDSPRISNIARHTANSNYTAPTAKLTADANTLVLFPFANCYDIFCDAQIQNASVGYLPIRVNAQQTAITNTMMSGLNIGGAGSGFYCFLCQNTTFRDMIIGSTGGMGVLFQNNSYENNISNILVNGNARLGFVQTQAAGVENFSGYFQITGSKFQFINLNGSGKLDLSGFVPSNQTLHSFIIKGTGPTVNATGTWTLINPICDQEAGGTAYLSCGFLSSLNSVNIINGELDNLGSTVPSYSMMIDGGNAYKLDGSAFNTTGTPGVIVHVITNPSVPILFENPVQRAAFTGFVDNSAPYQVMNGVLGNTWTANETHSGTETFSGNVTATAGQNSINFNASDSIIYVDGTLYPRTCAGINSAIAAAPGGGTAAGSKIVVGYGDVPCSATILIDKPITLEMSGEAGRLIPQSGFAGPVIKMFADSNSVVNQFGAAIGMRLKNVWIEDTAFRSQQTDGIWIIHADQVDFENVEVKWLKGYALRLDDNGNNNTPVRESIFRNFISWGNGDPAQSKPSIDITTNSFAGSDEINEIRFVGGGVKNEWWEAIRINTGQTASVGAPLGPRHIYFDDFQIEARQDLDCAGGAGGVACASPVPPAVAPFSDNVHIVQGNNISFHHSSVSNAGQGKSAIRIDGTSNNPVQAVALNDMVVGGNPSLTGFLTCTNVANSVCSWVSGNQFQPFDSNSWVGLTISIPAAACTTSCVVSSIQSTTQITLTTNTGAITNVAYTVTSGGFGVTPQFVNSLKMSGIRWLTNPNGNLNSTIPNTGNYVITELAGTAPALVGGDVFGDQQCLGSDCAIGFINKSTPNGQKWGFDSKSDGSAAIVPSGGNTLLDIVLGGTTRIPNSAKFIEVGNGSTVSGAGFDDCYADSTLHGLLCNPNGAGWVPLPKTVALTADWTCGTGGTVSSCTSATVVGSGGGVPLTFTLPLVATSTTLECDGVVGQATAATANQWNLLTATNGATNVTAIYDMYTAATAKAGGSVTDQASTTTTFQIAPSWTLGGTGTKMPFHIWAKIEGASASGTVVSLQLVAPTVGDLVTIYRGAACRLF